MKLKLLSLVATSLVSVVTAGCTNREPAVDAGAGTLLDGRAADARWFFGDTAFDPFDPTSACGATAIPTQQVAGSMLIVFDRSSSMDEDPDGNREGDRNFRGPSKWDRSEAAINSVLAATGDDLNAGLLLFPSGEGEACDVTVSARVPRVAVAPLGTTRAVISSALAGGTNGSVTPIFDALRAGWAYLDTLDTSGQRGLILVTDGAENCDAADEAAILSEAQARRDTNGYLTYAVGLDNSSNTLSTLAVNGGTARNDTCMASCVPPVTTCTMPTDCGPGVSCIFGFCVSTAPSDCCHYNVAAATFTSDFETVLDAIAQRFLESCVFELPRGADPSMFDPAEVNVGVTFFGEPRTVLRRSMDSTTSSWDFTSTDYESIVVQGPICDQLLAGDATVEIVLGCPTLIL